MSKDAGQGMIRNMGHGAGGGRPPYGWTATGGGAQAFAPVPEEIAVLALIAEMRDRQEMTLMAIADALNAAGYRTKLGAYWSPRRVFAALHIIRRFGIPDDIDAAISSAYEKAEMKGGRSWRRMNKKGSNPNANTSVTRVARGA